MYLTLLSLEAPEPHVALLRLTCLRDSLGLIEQVVIHGM
jgi:hypothetical protein